MVSNVRDQECGGWPTGVLARVPKVERRNIANAEMCQEVRHEALTYSWSAESARAPNTLTTVGSQEPRR
jgi:hypothetical protein